MLKAFADCFKIPELRKRILFTLFILALCRVAQIVNTPGINVEALDQAFETMRQNQAGTSGGILGMFDMFTGGALQRFAVAALGIMPYITASIIIQLLTPIYPTLERWKREGETGMQKINQWTRYLTLLICIVQGFMAAKAMENPNILPGVDLGPNVSFVYNPGLGFELMTVIILTCGTMILMWLGEQITDRGIGQGASLIITVGIIELAPSAIGNMWTLYQTAGTSDTNFGLIHVLILIALFLLVTAATVALTVGVRKIPIQYARTMSVGRQGGKAPSSFFPLRVNYASVMPIIFAQALLMFPPFLIGIMAGTDWLSWAVVFEPLFTHGTVPYMVIYALLLILFTFFWVSNQFNTVQIADDLKRNNAYIPGVRPGKPTADFLDWSMTRVTMFGSLYLVALALFPMIIVTQMPIDFMIASFFGGSSLIIIVGVMLDTMRQAESHLLMHGYDTFSEKGRLRGRGRY